MAKGSHHRPARRASRVARARNANLVAGSGVLINESQAVVEVPDEHELTAEEEEVLPRLQQIPGLHLDNPYDLVTAQERAEFQKVAEEIDRARRLAESKLPSVVID
jgi:hypothetical protein